MCRLGSRTTQKAASDLTQPGPLHEYSSLSSLMQVKVSPVPFTATQIRSTGSLSR